MPFYFQFSGCLCSFSANFPVNVCVLSCSISVVSLIATCTWLPVFSFACMQNILDKMIHVKIVCVTKN